MKFLLGFVLGMSPALASWDAAETAVRRGIVHGDRLVVKLAGDARAPLAFSGLPAPEIRPLFPGEAEAYRRERVRLRMPLPALETYREIRFPRALAAEEALGALAALKNRRDVELAYFEPKAENAVLISAPVKAAPFSRADTPDYQDRQFYLEAPPRGVNALAAWKLPAGDGSLVKLIDIEWGWETRHEDFRIPFWEKSGNGYRDHGTAVWGEVAAKNDGGGVTGIAHGAGFGVQAYTNAGSYEQAGAQLAPGDILIIEQHSPGPDGGKYAPMEYWQANFDAMKVLSARGILVIAAAGNGGSNLDGSAYNKAFDVSHRDSGAILVGAGAPPGGSHLTRLGFSNYGSRVDAFAYGGSVVTTGYGDLFNGGRTRTYTAKFSGTSSATPIVAGAAAVVQSIAKSRGRIISPREMRDALRKTGTPQKGNTVQRIGNLPDILALLTELGLPASVPELLMRQ